MERLLNQLNKRKSTNSFRELRTPTKGLIDFSSNDYLGLAQSKELKETIMERYSSMHSLNGSTGSRLITGNSQLTEATESLLADVFQSESTLVFNSGYMANLALFSAIPQRGDTILYDELSHACIKDGARLSLARKMPFKHNALDDLSRKLEQSEGQVYVAVESVYSMDGDAAPLQELVTLTQKHKAHLIIDEAHSTGVFGKNGSGMVNELGLGEQVFAVVYTFGKGMGIHGAAIATNATAKDYLINFSRPFIYTTAPSDFELISIQEAFGQLSSAPWRQLKLQANSQLFNSLLPENASPSAIKAVVVGGNDKTKSVASELLQLGLDVRPILSPTVKEGTERLRICLHSFNTEEEIVLLCGQLKRLTKRSDS
ncbi:aminotransferase class I/II-fold pyridoxal phosphate-dependent enzyme [Roseivirga thermotolerans]|uniref:8-amino-7-oxononanoate synthase n=1 Tax=Roseivirga thermotolerans TaxID=1758176 RepID=A0ABQ3I556_9BACT|nr:8-amino-7-oxononanoate synthase [Roseivirga thermotolerans]GHE65359.1 8-amino-7-oxononanoate synthase [Roseivirga thermotolerans]